MKIQTNATPRTYLRCFEHWNRDLGFGKRAKIQAFEAVKVGAVAASLVSSNPAFERCAASMEKKILHLQERRNTVVRKLYSTVTDDPYSGHGLFHPDRGFVDCNPKICEWMRCSREDILGHSPVEFMPKYQSKEHVVNRAAGKTGPIALKERESADIAKCCIEKALSLQIVTQPFTQLRSDGTTFESIVVLMPLRIGGTTLIHATMHDRTEELEHQRLLTEERNMLRSLINSIPGIRIFIKDTDGRFVVANKACIEFFGCSDEGDLIGKSDSDFFDPEMAARFEQSEKELLATGNGIFNLEERATDAAGNSTWCLTNKVPYKDSQGNVAGIMGINVDITGIKQLQAQLNQAHKTEMLGLLAGGVAHDLNNFLQPILGYLDLLAPAISNPDDKRILEEMGTAADNAKTLIRNMLNLSRQGAARKDYVEIKEVLAEFLPLVKASKDLKNIRVETYYNCWSNTVFADKIQLEQVLMNLMINAAHAMAGKNDGRIDIGLSETEITQETSADYDGLAPGQYLRLTVADNGSGIPEEVMPRIFDAFFTTKEPGKGTGLGLPMVKDIVSRHNGTIQVLSEPGQGSIFSILLPLATGKEHK